MTQSRRYPSIRSQAGVSLIEVLVTLVIMAVGLLGLGSLNLSGMRQSLSANNLGVATQLAEEIAERMRGNIPGVNANLYTGLIIQNDLCSGGGACAAAGARTCYGTDCSTNANALVTAEVNEWHGKLCALMPCEATASVTCIDANGADGDACTNGSLHLIQLTWNDVTQVVADGVRTAQAEAKTLQLAFNPINPRQ